MIGFPHKWKSTDLGSHPLENLARDSRLIKVESDPDQLDLPTYKPVKRNNMAHAAKRTELNHSETITAPRSPHYAAKTIRNPSTCNPNT